MTEQDYTDSFDPATASKKVAIAPRFDKAELDEIDRFRGERTKTEFVYDAVLSAIKLCQWKALDAKKKAVVLKHDCGTKYAVLPSGNDVFLLCPKCHKSKKLTKAEYEAAILANCTQPTPQVQVLPSTTPPAINPTATN